MLVSIAQNEFQLDLTFSKKREAFKHAFAEFLVVQSSNITSPDGESMEWLDEAIEDNLEIYDNNSVLQFELATTSASGPLRILYESQFS